MLSNQWKSLHLGLWELVFKVMDEGSITRVADMNSIQRSRLSRLISSLEEETGHRLLERQGRKLEPTMAALELRAKIEPMISDIRKTLEAEKENADSDKGGIRFGAMPGFLQTQVVPLIAEFQKRHPQVSFDVIGDDDPKAFMGGQTFITVRSTVPILWRTGSPDRFLCRAPLPNILKKRALRLLPKNLSIIRASSTRAAFDRTRM